MTGTLPQQTLHVVGAGMAGLACAVAAARGGWRVALHEAAPQAGGRCRSFRCDRLDRMIDNGTHLMLGANRHALAFATAIGGHETLEAVAPLFPFLDLASGRQWVLSPGKLTSGVWETVAAMGLPWVPAGQSVAGRLGGKRSFAALWQPLCEAMLNTQAEDASAKLFGCVLRELLMGGKTAMRPFIAQGGLSAAFAAPAIATLGSYGAQVNFRRRLVAVGDRSLEFDDGTIALGPHDRVVLALPPWAASELLPGLPPMPTRAIVNAHYRLNHPAELPGGQRFLGLIGGMAQWLFVRDDVASVTISAADRLLDMSTDDLAATLWRDVAALLGADPARLPPCRVIKERRATLAHTPEVVENRPGPATKIPFLWLAGDWMASPWPCTIEAAIASGLTAARLAIGRDDLSFA
ncbi:MAG: FAD-dependent oxidoreductase [Rhodospirillaceae bacterium]|nr:FAD-dependent oxidoreductase [Rhodospirillales bacterium]